MNKTLAVVAALLLGQVAIINVAAAVEIPGNPGPEYLSKDTNASHKQKKAEKLLGMMKSVGISDSGIARLVNEVDANTKDGQLMLYKNEVAGGKISLRYEFNPDMNNKKLGLFYQPENSHTEYSVHTNGAMVRYKFKF